MNITLSPQDYAHAYRILSSTARNPENVERVVQERLLPRLPPRPSLLDVGAGPGKVAERLAPHFGSLTLLEPNREQLPELKLEGAKLFHVTLERYASPEKYDLVLCSHVLYHVPFADWGGFIDRLLAFVRPGGACVILLAAPRGQNYQLHRDFTERVLTSEHVLELVRRMQLPHEVVAIQNSFSAAHFEEMYTLCRFFVLEDCYTAEQLAALSEADRRKLEEKIRVHAECCQLPDGSYRLEQEEDLIILSHA